MNTTSTPRRNPLPGLLLALAALGLVAYYFWPHKGSEGTDNASASNATAANAEAAGNAGAGAPAGPKLSPANGPMPPGTVSNVGGIPLDANGNRILNEAGLPISNEPLPQAKPIPIKAPAGAIIGYTKDAQGNVQPLRAGNLKQIPNSPGTYAVVDMWADGGPTVIPATEGKRLSPAELQRLQDAERAREQAANKQP